MLLGGSTFSAKLLVFFFLVFKKIALFYRKSHLSYGNVFAVQMKVIVLIWKKKSKIERFKNKTVLK